VALTSLDPVTLTFDLWPWKFAAYRQWRDETLYQIWTQSNNPRRSYCDFSVWSYDLEHRVTCCARLWDKFHQVWPSTTYPCPTASGKLYQTEVASAEKPLPPTVARRVEIAKSAENEERMIAVL